MATDDEQPAEASVTPEPAEPAGPARWRRDPGLVGAADAASRAWGGVVLAVGLWFFKNVTLGLAMPDLPVRDLWPVALIVIGLAVVVRGFAPHG